MSLETIQTEIAALRNDVKNLTKLVRKVKNTQEDPDGEKAKARAENNGFNRKQEITPKLREFLALPRRRSHLPLRGYQVCQQVHH